MRLEVAGQWLICIPMLHVAKRASGIVLPSTNQKVSRAYLVEEAGGSAGYHPGDIIIAKGGHDIKLYGGTFVRTTIDLLENNNNVVIARVRDAGLDEFTDIDGKPILELITAELARAAGWHGPSRESAHALEDAPS